jgi:plasmid maintenance system antidote protein VapI
MNTSNDFLDAVKAKTGAVSDYSLAQKLEITRAAVSKYRNNRSNLDDETCLKVARILGIDAGIVLAAIHAERAKSVDEKSAWTALFERLGGVAASVMIATTIFSNSAPVEASERVTSRNDVYYVNTIT